MSYISDYLSGNTDKAEFDMYGDMENRQERWEEEHKYEEPCDDSNANQHNFNALNDAGQHTNALEGDAVSRQAVMDVMRRNHRHGGRDIDGDYIEGDYREHLYDDIISLPPVTPQPKMGHWIRWYEHKENERCIVHIPHCKCSECGTEYDSHSSRFIKYCNECGAKMVEPQERSDKE